MTFRAALSSFIVLITAALVLSACAPSKKTGPVIFAASSLQTPLEELADEWRAQGNDAPVLSFASSTALARQIDNGSIADLYVSADTQWIEYIVGAGRIDRETVRTIASNRLVLAAHIDGLYNAGARGTSGAVELPSDATITSGDPDSVPLGRFAKEALMSADLWEDVGPRLIRSASSSAALRLVLLQETDLGILYASDAARRDDLATLITFDTDTHSPIRYQALQLPSSSHPQAVEFLTFLASPQAAGIFKKYGFGRP